MQESAFFRMCKVLAGASGMALASFLYSLWTCGTWKTGYLVGLVMAFFVFAVSMFGGVVLYLE